MAIHSIDSQDIPAAPRVRVTLAHDAGWLVERTDKDGSVSVVHCSSWHRVERTCLLASSQPLSVTSPGAARCSAG